ncbi:MAG: DNA primase [Kiritimatiellae bacterium]|nr:DNA primase [Kiritimatiellia bacterium]MBR0458151.1 DNA primase [Victivallales bacterium]
MPHIPEDIIDQIKQRADIVEIAQSFFPVHKRGGDFWACCPFHHEKTPSFKLNEERQAFYCFGCKAHGSVVDFVKSMVNTDFPGAMRWLADRYGIVIPETDNSGLSQSDAERLRKLREKRMLLLRDAAAWFHSLLQRPEAQVARNYLDGRGLDAEAISRFQLGYSLNSWDALIQWATPLGYDMQDLLATGLITQREDSTSFYDRFRNRLMFPICNELGKVVGFSARILETDAKAAKYVNSPETEFFEKGKLLYGLHLARTQFKERGYVLVCEGQLDVIACHRAGLTNAVAAQGTAFTEMHARLLRKSADKIVLSFDADTAGYKAARRTISILHGVGFDVKVVTLPEGEDPDSVFRKGGAAGLQQVMSITEPAIPYLYRVSCQEVDAASPKGKSVIVNQVLEAIKPIQDQVARIAHCQWLAQEMHLPENIILKTLEAMPSADERHRQTPQLRPVPPPIFLSPASPDEAAWTMILDLALHFQEFASQLAFDPSLPALFPKTPLGQALTHLVVFTEQDEWKGACDELSKLPVFQDAAVGKAIVASEYPFTPRGQTIPPQAATAYEDCVRRVKSTGLSRLILEKQEAMQQETDPEKARAMQSELTTLIRQRVSLQSRH